MTVLNNKYILSTPRITLFPILRSNAITFTILILIANAIKLHALADTAVSFIEHDDTPLSSVLLSSNSFQLTEHSPIEQSTLRTRRRSITICAGVLHAPPFASIDEDNVTGKLRYSGFQIDLLNSLTVFAFQDDNIELKFDLSPAPTTYDDALDMVAKNEYNSDNTTMFQQPYNNGTNPQQCKQFHLIVGDYFSNPDRSLRVDFTPVWLRTTLSSVKYVDNDSNKKRRDYKALAKAEAANATVCVPDGTYLMQVVMKKFPGAQYLKCPTLEACIDELKSDNCVLYAEDELKLRYHAKNDPSLVVTFDQFNTQYIVWPMSYKLDHIISQLMKKWIYKAVVNTTTDYLYHQYFEPKLCPFGSAGTNCDLPCHPKHGTSDVEGKCVCSSMRYTGDDCSIEVMENTNRIPLYIKALGYTMFGVNAAICLICAMWLIYRRHLTQIKIAQPFLLAMVLLGCLISSSAIITLGQEDDDNVPTCMISPWLFSVGFSITFGTLFGKIRRVYALFKAASSMQRRAVTVKETMIIIGAVLFVDVCVLLIWTIHDPLKWKRDALVWDQYGYVLESRGLCHSEFWQVYYGVIGVYHFILMGFATYMCIVSRHISDDFSEHKYVEIAMVSNIQILMVGSPVLLLLYRNGDPARSYFVKSGMVWLNDLIVVSLIFGHLIYSVEVQRRNSNRDTSDLIRSAVKRYTENARSSEMLERR